MSKPSQISFKEFYPLAFPEPVEPIVCAPSQETPVRGLAAPSEVRARIRAERRAQFRELGDVVRSMREFHGGETSNGGYVLMELANIAYGYVPGTSTRLNMLQSLRCHAARAIGAGC